MTDGPLNYSSRGVVVYTLGSDTMFSWVTGGQCSKVASSLPEAHKKFSAAKYSHTQANVVLIFVHNKIKNI